MTHEDSLVQNLKLGLSLPDPAVEWLMMLWQAIQVFDDIADGDEVERKALNTTIWNTLVAMNVNSFYRDNALVLTPIIASAILKWQASDQAERAGNADPRSFVWRAGFYDVVLMTVQLCHGVEPATRAASSVMNLYGEDYQDYMKEHEHA